MCFYYIPATIQRYYPSELSYPNKERKKRNCGSSSQYVSRISRFLMLFTTIMSHNFVLTSAAFNDYSSDIYLFACKFQIKKKHTNQSDTSKNTHIKVILNVTFNLYGIKKLRLEYTYDSKSKTIIIIIRLFIRTLNTELPKNVYGTIMGF